MFTEEKNNLKVVKDFPKIISETYKLHDNLINDCTAMIHLTKKGKELHQYKQSIRELERFVIIPHIGGYSINYVLRILFLIEGHLSRHFKGSKGYTNDIKKIEVIRDSIYRLSRGRDETK